MHLLASARRPRLVGSSLALALAALVLGSAPGAGGAEARTPSAHAVQAGQTHTGETQGGEFPQVHEMRVIGQSVRGEAIRAYRMGDPEARITAVVLGSMHGDEPAGTRLARALVRSSRPVTGINLWVVPTMNPDGLAARTRSNSRGVDLNRNWGHDWAPLDSPYYSGPRAWSEPETRAMRDFLREVAPLYVASIHQPLKGIGITQDRVQYQKRLARGLNLPRKAFNCTGVCHGTMTAWHNARLTGTAVTVEFGARPGVAYLTGRAMRGVVRAFLGDFAN